MPKSVSASKHNLTVPMAPMGHLSGARVAIFFVSKRAAVHVSVVVCSTRLSDHGGRTVVNEGLESTKLKDTGDELRVISWIFVAL
eukprot:s462_g38.t1